MYWRNPFTTLVAVAALSLPTAVSAALVTNPARPIAYRVDIQLIDTALDDGSSPATVLGDDAQRADIEAKIDTIWAQAGIDINFLPNVVQYNNTFAYQGAGTARPDSDLSLIIDNVAPMPGILNSDPKVIDMFFVNIVPGWPPEGSNWINGESNIGTNGITEHMGSTVPTTDHGRELAAHWIAHEIGHNLGLYHPADGSQNLMNGSTRTTEQLTPEQIYAIYQWNFRNDSVAYIPQGGTGFPHLIPSPVSGDYNRNGTVDAADYTVWRDTMGTIGYMAADGNKNNAIDVGDLAIWQSNLDKQVLPQSLPGDFNHDGLVDGADYTVWRDTMGKTVAAGTGADASVNGLVDAGDYGIWKTNFSMASSVVVGAAAEDVPEPATIVYAAIAAMLLVPFRRGRCD
jgi:hypothetical protein